MLGSFVFHQFEAILRFKGEIALTYLETVEG